MSEKLINLPTVLKSFPVFFLKSGEVKVIAYIYFVAVVHGTSKDPCSDIYGGPKPFSEPETKALSDFILARNATWKVYLTLHSYSQMWMAPYGYTRKKPDNYESLVSPLITGLEPKIITIISDWNLFSKQQVSPRETADMRQL